MTKGRLIFLCVALGVFALDRLTKGLVVAGVPVDGERIYLVDHLLWITHIQNSGAAFGLNLVGPYVFLLFSLVVAAGLVVYESRNQGGLWSHVILGLVLGGTVGNGYDRLLFGGSVTDFIEVPHWPVFNIADSAISTGVVLVVVGYLRRRESS